MPVQFYAIGIDYHWFYYSLNFQYATATIIREVFKLYIYNFDVLYIEWVGTIFLSHPSDRFITESQIFKRYYMTKTAMEGKQVKKVLIVEDEGDMCLLLNILLNGDEMELDHVQNLVAADEYLQKEVPSVIILDNKLPDGFGVDFISYIKKKYPGVGIIMISGFDASARDVALENGADIFLEKPFTKDQLYNSIKRLLN
jgi:two-component system OmpR family response regulator